MKKNKKDRKIKLEEHSENPLITLFSEGFYLYKHLINKYSIEQIKQYLEINAYIKKLNEKRLKERYEKEMDEFLKKSHGGHI